MTCVHVFGIGSPFGDDRVGWQVVDDLKNQPELMPYVPHSLLLESCDRPQLRLLSMMEGADWVYLIDAMKSGVSIGKIQRFIGEEVASFHSCLTTHGVGLAQALSMGDVLGCLPKQLVVYGIEIEDVGLQDALTPTVDNARLSLVKTLKQELYDILFRERSCN